MIVILPLVVHLYLACSVIDRTDKAVLIGHVLTVYVTRGATCCGDNAATLLGLVCPIAVKRAK